MRQSRLKEENCEGDSCAARLFVYGTLRKGQRSHKVLAGLRARFMAKGYVQGCLYDLGQYPGAVKGAGGSDRVFGEVYLLVHPSLCFKTLDRFEGFDPQKNQLNLFERSKTRVKLRGGEETDAWIYWLPNARRPGRLIPSGDYAKYRG